VDNCVETYFPVNAICSIEGIYNVKITNLPIILGSIFIICGCQTISPNINHQENSKDNENIKESNEEIQTALESIIGVISQKDAEQVDLRALGKQLRKDKEAQSAVRVISDSMSGKNLRIKYCPESGRRYDPKIIICPIHEIPLEYVED